MEYSNKSLEFIPHSKNNINLIEDLYIIENVMYSREFLIQCYCDEVVVFLSDIPFRKPKTKQINQHQPKLIIAENSWSINRNLNNDDFEEVKKKCLSLSNKLTIEKYDTISTKFINIMNEYTFSKDQLYIFISNIYEIILKQLMYNNTFSRIFKKYNNNEFNNILIEHVMKEFSISIGEIEDTRNITSMI